MRRKVTILLALTGLMLGIVATPAGRAWAASQPAALKSVTVSSGPARTELILHVVGSYTYKTSESVPGTVFVDLFGAKVVGAVRNQDWENPVLAGYKLLSYQDSTGQSIVRVLVNEKQPGPYVVQKDAAGLHLVYAQTSSPKAAAAVIPASVPDVPAAQSKAAAIQPEAPAIRQEAPGTHAQAPAIHTEAPATHAEAPAIHQEPPAVRAENSLVSNVTINKQESGQTFVDVATSGAASYRVLSLSNPRRLVVDINGLRNSTLQNRYAVDTAVLKDVRVGQFHAKDPSVVRIVADLNGNPTFDVHAFAQGVRIELHPRELQSSAPVAARQPAPASAPAPVAPLAIAAVKPIPVQVVEPAKPVSTPQVVQSKPAVIVARQEPIQQVQPAVISNAPKVAVTPKVSPAPAVEVAKVRVTPKPSPAPAVEVAKVTMAPKPSPAPVVEVAKVAEAPKPIEVAVQQPIVVPAVHVESTEEVKVDVQSTLPALAASNQALAAPVPPPASVTPEAMRADYAAITLGGENIEAGQSGLPAGLEGPYNESKTTYTGETISLNLKDVDLKDFFRLIHEISGLNIILDPNVAGSVTLVLDSVPWDQALDIVLKNNRLGKVMEGNVLRIARIETLTAEQEGVTKLASARMDAAPLVTVFRPINYAKATEIAALLKTWAGGAALSRRGTVLVDLRSNTLIISDVQSQVTVVEGIVARLDKKAKQISIEARVVLATADFTRTLSSSLLGGFQNRSTAATSTTGSPTSSISIPTPTPSTPFPLTTATNATASGFGVASVVNVGANYFINAAISAAEERDQAKTISRPSIVTQNNVQGMVMQGVQVPIQTSINNTIAVQYENATLQLTVTPQVTDDNNIFLTIMVNNASVGATVSNAGPSINTQQATTAVMVPDGGTVVFGGITVTGRTRSATYVPVLGNIPILGHLFKTSNSDDQDQELLFFVTPKILPG